MLDDVDNVDDVDDLEDDDNVYNAWDVLSRGALAGSLCKGWCSAPPLPQPVRRPRQASSAAAEAAGSRRLWCSASCLREAEDLWWKLVGTTLGASIHFFSIPIGGMASQACYWSTDNGREDVGS